jgi:hypothetical protein
MSFPAALGSNSRVWFPVFVRGSIPPFGGFTALTLFRAFFAPRLGLALAKRFLGAALATMRFAGLPRAD